MRWESAAVRGVMCLPCGDYWARRVGPRQHDAPVIEFEDKERDIIAVIAPSCDGSVPVKAGNAWSVVRQ